MKKKNWGVEWNIYKDRETGATVKQLTGYYGHHCHLCFTNPGWYDNGKKMLLHGNRDNASMAISKSSVKDETRLRHCLSFINNLGVPVWQSLVGVGIEGEHHSIVDGFAVQNEEQGHKWGAIANQYGQINCFGGGVIDRAIPIKRIPAIEAIEAEQVTYVSSCVMDPTTPRRRDRYQGIRRYGKSQ